MDECRTMERLPPKLPQLDIVHPPIITLVQSILVIVFERGGISVDR